MTKAQEEAIVQRKQLQIDEKKICVGQLTSEFSLSSNRILFCLYLILLPLTT